MMYRKPYVMPLTDFESSDDACDLDQLLHPAQAFEHPSNVVNDPDLTLNEKRAILASWASDACAIEAAPALRRAPCARQPVHFDDVIEALRERDLQAKNQGNRSHHYKRILRSRRLASRRGPSDQGQGPSPN
jgi:hypothetical protein